MLERITIEVNVTLLLYEVSSCFDASVLLLFPLNRNRYISSVQSLVSLYQ
jgi:hypothetical protein